ncbi:intein-containing Rv2578c family radical SAM protein [Microbacterium sp.]|uniref:intein-containing Rv2578c family radical SAM protein n=1 Tax=Microbacterium sp. TaxID=51671 RepID=UPI003736BD3D
MRWAGQAISSVDEAALPGMESTGGLVRTVTTPDFAGMTFHEVLAKSALNHVPQTSAMPFSWTVNPYRGCSHACVYCLDPDTAIMMADGRHRRLADLTVGDEIIGTVLEGAYRRYTPTRVLAKWHTRKRAHRITLSDGTEITASGDHRFLTNRGWKHVTGTTSGSSRRPHLTPGVRLQGFGLGGVAAQTSADDPDFAAGYLNGMIRGDGMIFHGSYADSRRVREIHRFRLALADDEALDRSRALPATPVPAWRAGFLSGIFDAEGSCSRGILRISNKAPDVLRDIADALALFGIPYVREPARPNGVAGIRVTGGMPSRRRFFTITKPAITRKLAVAGDAVKTVGDLRVLSITDLGYDIDMIDISTGTQDFIANGVISHNCFARNTHTYLDLDAGRDFDSQIVVKVNVAEVLRRELAKPTWAREPVALGTNTDPYQRAEGRYRLMPEIIDAFASSATPFSVLTKGTLLRRDLPLLADAATRVPVHIAMSLAVPDEQMRHLLEPGAPTFQARLDTVRAAADAGFTVTVFLMPIVPHLTDSIAALDDAIGRIAASGAKRVVFGALHLRPGAKEWFWEWLERERPDLVPAYRGLYPGVAVSAPKGYRAWLAERVRPLLRRHGLHGRLEEEAAPPRGASGPGPVRATGRSPAATANRGVTMKTATREQAAAMLF